MGTKVKAISTGFYDAVYRNIGDVFRLKDGDKPTASWQQVVEEAKPVKPEKQKPAEKVDSDLV